MKIKAILNIDNEKIPCTGEIEIHQMKESQAYITWRIFCNDRLFASKSENYYFKENDMTSQDLLNKVLMKIGNYRINRKKIFEKVEACSEELL